MTPADREYIDHRLARANDAIGEAKVLLNAGYANAAVNRLYYACFYAATALLHSEGFSSSKHSGVIALFDRHWIKPNRLPKEMGKFFHSIFDHRQESDYKQIVDFDAADVAAWLEQTKEFVQRLSEQITKSG